MSEAAQGLAGLLLLLCLTGLVQVSRNPDRTFGRLVMFAGALLIVGAAVFAIRGDYFQPSGLDDVDSGCGYARVR